MQQPNTCNDVVNNTNISSIKCLHEERAELQNDETVVGTSTQSINITDNVPEASKYIVKAQRTTKFGIIRR